MTTEPSDELRDQIQTYEKRIHDLSENVEMLKERVSTSHYEAAKSRRTSSSP